MGWPWAMPCAYVGVKGKTLVQTLPAPGAPLPAWSEGPAQDDEKPMVG